MKNNSYGGFGKHGIKVLNSINAINGCIKKASNPRIYREITKSFAQILRQTNANCLSHLNIHLQLQIILLTYNTHLSVIRVTRI